MILIQVIVLTLVIVEGRRAGYKKYEGEIQQVVINRLPFESINSSDLPENVDWRNMNGTNFCSPVLNQKNPYICGSCWAEAAMGAVTDRYRIATGGKLNIQLAVQNLLNFEAKTTGGDCDGGDSEKAYEFMYKYKMTDESCSPFLGMGRQHGFEVSEMTEVEDVTSHLCWSCDWNGACGFLPLAHYNSYGLDEFGTVLGEEQMMAEIAIRGPIACSLNSEAPAFNQYKGGIIQDIKGDYNSWTDHVVVIAGYGVDKQSGLKYWVGRNSYGGQWGEGAGGGWFRLERGVNALAMEQGSCSWGVPASADVERVLQQFGESLAV
jgi:cathepsin X